MQSPSSCFKFLPSHLHPVHGRNTSRYGMSVVILGCCSAIPFCWSFQGGWWECPCHHNHICPDFGTGNHSVLPSLPQHLLSLRGAQLLGHSNILVSKYQVSELVGTNWRQAEGRAGGAGIYVLRGPLLNMSILAIVHFMAQSSAASFSNPDGLNWHFHYMCLH